MVPERINSEPIHIGMNMRALKFLRLVEMGKLLWPIQILIFAAITIAVMLSEMGLTTIERTVVYRREERVRQYHVKKVSQLPKALEDEEAKKIAIEKEALLTADDLRNRYFSYVISRIKRFKEYPKLEQRKGHEGSVLLEIFISRNGNVRKVRILRQARYTALTEAAITSIRRALPFQPFHKRLTDEELIVRLEITFCLN
jgi:TonB family protein